MLRRLSYKLGLFFAAFLVAPGITGAPLGPAEPMASLNGGVFGHQGVVVNNTIYVISQKGYVAYAMVGTDGILTPWNYMVGRVFPAGIGTVYFCAAAWNGRVYVLGGNDQDTATATVAMAQAKPGGGLEDWTLTMPLPEPRAGGAVIAVDGRLYYAGGQSHRDVFVARILDDGRVGEWKTTQRLPYNRTGALLLAHGGYLYLVGGQALHQRPADTAFRAKITADGMLEKWRRTEPLPEPRSSHAGVVVGDDVFVWGGAAGPDAEQTATACTTKIGADHHFGDWTELPPLPMAASGLQAISIGKWVYVIGGITLRPEGNRVWETVWRYTVEDK